jgi:hypothetical protein
MIRSQVVRFRVLTLLAMCLAMFTIASCSEDIQGGKGCPLLCPQQATPLFDTTLDAVTFDTSVSGFPPLGFESTLLLSKQGDSLDAGIVSRYDSMPTHFSVKGQDSAITHVDSAFIRGLRIASDTDSTFKLHDAATVEVYDVTDVTADTTTSALVGAMIPGNRIGALDLAQGANPDTLQILLDTSRVRSRVVDSHRLRIALRMVTAGSAQLRFLSRDQAAGFALTVYPSRDSSAEVLSFTAQSDTTGTPFPTVAAALADFPVVVARPPSRPGALRVGGYPAQRVLMRFKIPRNIIDSSAVVRATLFLTQFPSTAPRSGDSVFMFAVPIVSSALVTDPHLELEFAASPAIFPNPDSVRLVPKDSGRKQMDIVKILRDWRGQDTLKTPRAIALVIGGEGATTPALDFFSMEAATGLRPQLRITYAAKPSSGRP